MESSAGRLVLKMFSFCCEDAKQTASDIRIRGLRLECVTRVVVWQALESVGFQNALRACLCGDRKRTDLVSNMDCTFSLFKLLAASGYRRM